MSTQTLAKTGFAILTFAVVFVVVFGTLSLLSFLGFDAYGSPVAGAVAGGASAVLSLTFKWRRSRGVKSSQLYKQPSVN